MKNIELPIDYATAFEKARAALRPVQVDILVALSNAPGDGLSASEIAEKLGLGHHASVNTAIAGVGKALAEAAGTPPPKRENGSSRFWHVVALGRKVGTRFCWRLRPALRDALVAAGIATRGDAEAAANSPGGSDRAPAPAPERYVEALTAVHLTERERRMLVHHYAAPAQTVTAKSLAVAMGYPSHSAANAGYGRLGRKLGTQLGYSPQPEQLGSLITFRMVDDEWNWILRPEAARALEQLGWVSPLSAASTAEPQRVQVSTVAAQALAARQDAEARCEPFDPTDEQDARNRVLASLVRRQGQGAFRRELLASYGGRCAITGCTVEDVLEAAHILPYRGERTNHVTNGLLLRSDLHALFDLHLIQIDPETYTIRIDSTLRTTPYGEWHERGIHLPENPQQRPSVEALRRRMPS